MVAIEYEAMDSGSEDIASIDVGHFLIVFPFSRNIFYTKFHLPQKNFFFVKFLNNAKKNKK